MIHDLTSPNNQTINLTNYQMKTKILLRIYTLGALVLLINIHALAQHSLPGVLHQRHSSSASITELIESGDSILENPLSAHDSTYIKEYQRWRRDAVAHSMYPNPTGSVTRSDIASYLSTIPLFCYQGPANHAWSLVGPHPSPSNFQEAGIVFAVAQDPNNSNIIYVGTEDSGIWKTIDGGQNWTHLTDGLNVIGIGITSIAINPSNPQELVAGTVAHSFSLHYNQYAGNDGIGVIRSTDGGVTWNVSNYTLGGQNQPLGSMGHIKELKFSPHNSAIVFAVGQTELFKSNDGGATFDRVYEMPMTLNDNGNLSYGNYFADVEFLLSNPNIVLVTCARNELTYTFNNTSLSWVYTSDQAGASGSWSTPIIPQLQKSKPILPNQIWHTPVVWVDATSADSSKLFLLFKLPKKYRRQPFFFRLPDVYGLSTNDGVNFIEEFYDSNSFYLSGSGGTMSGGITGLENNGLFEQRRGFEVSELSTNRWYISGNTVMVRDATSGYSRLTLYEPRSRSTTPQNSTHADIRDLKIVGAYNGEDVLLIANDGGVAKSYDGGVNWSNINGHGLTISQFFGFDYGPNHSGFIGSAIHNGNYQINEDGSWRAFIGRLGDGEFAERVHLTNGEHLDVFMVGPGSRMLNIFPSSGSSWRYPRLYQSDPHICTGNLGRRFCIDPTWSSSTATGEEIRRLYAWGRDLKAVDISKSYVDTAQFIFKTSAEIPGVQMPDISMFRLSLSNPDVGYLAFEGFPNGNPTRRHMLWKTTDGGASWSNINPQFTLGNQLINEYSWVMDILIHPKDENMVFVSMANFHKDASGYGENRVLFTQNGGLSWQDYSVNLPAVPANTMALDGDNMLYVGTDAGVYYIDISNPQPTDSWICFNRDLPNAMVEQLRIDPCEGMIYAAIRGMGIWEAPLIPSETDPITVSGNPTWDGLREIQGDVIVPFNTHLTITGTVFMGQTSQIIVKPGGRLTISGGTVTTKCGDYWGGIYVAGNSNQAQTLQHQGILEIYNGGEVSRARDAITNIDIDPETGEWILGTTGGMIDCIGAVFRNNRRDIQLLRHKYSVENGLHYSAEIYNCQFLRDNNFGIETMLPSITLWDVHGIDIEGSVFKNENTSDFLYDGGGIYAINALFRVDEDMLGGCEFIGHGEAIHSENYALPLMANAELEFRHNSFEDNLHAIYVSGANMLTVVENDIEVPGQAMPSLPNPPNQSAHYGIYVDHCPTFDVRQNNLITDGLSGGATTVGIVINNAGGHNNNIYKNEIDGFTVGLEAIGDNRATGSGAADDGLFYRCNTLGSSPYWSSNFGNNEDVIVGNSGLPSQSSGIAKNHGFNPIKIAETLPNNVFMNSSQFYQFENTTHNTHNYYFEQDAPNVEPVNTRDVIKHRHTVQNFNWNNYCADLPEAEDFSIPGLTSSINTLKSDLASDLALRNQMLNGGNTPQLEAEILFANDQQEYQDLYVDLMNIAPYVEDQMLLDLIQISDYPELALRNIMVANPHASRSPEIWDMLINRQPLLSQQTLDDIQLEQQTITAYDVLEMSIGNTRAELDYHRDVLILKYLADFENHESTLYTFLANQDAPEYHYLLAEAQLAKGNTTAASSTLSNVPTACDLSEQEQLAHTDLVSLYNLLISASSEGELNDLSANEIASLQSLHTQGYGPSTLKAMALLKLNGEEPGYVEPILLPTTGLNKRSTEDAVEGRPEHILFDVRLYPNPSTGESRIEWNPEELTDVEELVVRITSLQGTTLRELNIDDVYQTFQVIDVTELSPGSYVVTLHGDGTELFQSVLIVD